MSEADKTGELSQNRAPWTPAQGHSGEGVNSAEHIDRDEGEDHQETLIDEAVDETFPASDPISPKHIT